MCVSNLPKVATQWNSGATRDSNRGRRVLIPSALTTTSPSHNTIWIQDDEDTDDTPCSKGTSYLCGWTYQYTTGLNVAPRCTLSVPHYNNNYYYSSHTRCTRQNTNERNDIKHGNINKKIKSRKPGCNWSQQVTYQQCAVLGIETHDDQRLTSSRQRRQL